VPISVVASFKKIKALITSHSLLATVLRNSSKLVSLLAFLLHEIMLLFNVYIFFFSVWISIHNFILVAFKYTSMLNSPGG